MGKKLSFCLRFFPLILSLLIALFILFFFRYLPPSLPLFYSLPWGEGQLGSHQQFFIIPSGIILITMLNYTIASQLHPTQTFFKKILYISSFICSLILTITFIKIILMFI